MASEVLCTALIKGQSLSKYSFILEVNLDLERGYACEACLIIKFRSLYNKYQGC